MLKVPCGVMNGHVALFCTTSERGSNNTGSWADFPHGVFPRVPPLALIKTTPCQQTPGERTRRCGCCICVGQPATWVSLMGITVDGEYYSVPRGEDKFIRVELADKTTLTCRRNKVKGSRRLENDTEMQRRVQAAVTKANSEQERLAPHSLSMLNPNPRPHRHSTLHTLRQPAESTGKQTQPRRVGEADKNPSPDSASKIGQPPEAKRRHLSPGGAAVAPPSTTHHLPPPATHHLPPPSTTHHLAPTTCHHLALPTTCHHLPPPTPPPSPPVLAPTPPSHVLL